MSELRESLRIIEGMLRHPDGDVEAARTAIGMGVEEARTAIGLLIGDLDQRHLDLEQVGGIDDGDGEPARPRSQVIAVDSEALTALFHCVDPECELAPHTFARPLVEQVEEGGKQRVHLFFPSFGPSFGTIVFDDPRGEIKRSVERLLRFVLRASITTTNTPGATSTPAALAAPEDAPSASGAPAVADAEADTEKSDGALEKPPAQGASRAKRLLLRALFDAEDIRVINGTADATFAIGATVSPSGATVSIRQVAGPSRLHVAAASLYPGTHVTSPVSAANEHRYASLAYVLLKQTQTELRLKVYRVGGRRTDEAPLLPERWFLELHELEAL